MMNQDIGLKPVNACVHTYTKPQTSSTRSRCLGWRIHESVEDTKLSTNKQHTLSSITTHLHPRDPYQLELEDWFRTRAYSELQFQVHHTTLNFVGAQCDYFIIMITKVPVLLYGHVYSSIYSYP